MTPAPANATWEEIRFLIQKYPNTTGHIKPQDMERHALDWVEDLSPYPLFIIKAACRDYRQSPEKFAPATSGALMPYVTKNMGVWDMLRRKIGYALGAIN